MPVTQLVIFVGLFFLLPLEIVHAEYFEGILHEKLYNQGKTSQARIFVKGSQVRLETEFQGKPNFILILNSQKNSYIFLRPSDKSAYQESFKNLRKRLGMKSNIENPSHSRTGETAMIAGYQTEQIIHEHKDGQITELWVTPNILLDPEAISGMREFCGVLSTANSSFDLEIEGSLPFRKIKRNTDGTIILRLEVTRVEHKPIQKDHFVVPSDYAISIGHSNEASEKQVDSRKFRAQ